jgi:FAD-dependent oxidoreductase domain-containing protein 1
MMENFRGGMSESVDVVIAGGGAVGSAVAYFLAQNSAFAGTVAVLEPDPRYEFAASARSAGSIRRQFSTPLNIALSEFGWQFLRSIPEVGLVESSYLLLASQAGLPALRENISLQHRCGVQAQLHHAKDLSRRYPWLQVEDLAAGADTASGEGWFDGYALLRSLRAANERRGVRYVRDRVLHIDMRATDAVGGVRLAGGGAMQCRYLVLAAGTGSRALAMQAGIDLPVFARKRNVFVFECATKIPRCPLVVDTSGLWFRPEGERFICGPAPETDPDVALGDFEVDHGQFDALAWPALAHRVPAFEAVRVTGAWAGHYDYNVFDQNAFVGPCDAVPNLLLANGFSGHGLQQAPGIGRALAEFIAHGEYRTIDVTPFSYSRYARQEPLREHNVI